MAHNKPIDPLLTGTLITAEQREAAGRRPSAAHYDNLVAQLARTGMLDRALRPGDPLPDFLLPSVDGRLVSRERLLASGPLLISFVRGQWCPYCRTEISALQAALPAILEAGATLVLVTPEVGGRADRMRRQMALSFQVLCDVDNGLALACGLMFRVPDAVRDLYLANGLDLTAHFGNEAWMLPVPATYGVDRDGIVRFAHLDVDFRNRLDPALFVEALQGLA